jgi:predicted AAA+ superfamily ATPase
MAEGRKLAISQDDLKKKALLWVQYHNARSGRTARQFIDHLSAELGMNYTPDSTLYR